MLVGLRPGECDLHDALEGGFPDESDQPARPHHFPMDVAFASLKTCQEPLLGQIGLADRDLSVTQNQGEHRNDENQPGEPESQMTAGKRLDHAPEDCGGCPDAEHQDAQG